MKETIVVALAGNPNSGKSTIFNNLTGARQHVGNYPGVTVERKEGVCRPNGLEMQIVDLPGIYSLTAYSAEELVARNFIIDEKPDVVIDIKEVFVAQMGIVYSVGEGNEESEDLRDQLRSQYTPLVAFCIMLFCLISAPCMATIAVTRRESNSWKWALLQLGGLTALAYVLTIFVFQTGSLLGIGVG
jgi:Fe2+ transport system protein B